MVVMMVTSDEYARWLEKFDARHTSDDTFTPPPVYDVVLDYVRNHYGLGDDVIIARPFYPGGDFEHDDYPAGCIVVDNPPFSMISRIVEAYHRMGVDYFLFAPGNILPGIKACSMSTYIATNISITYDNGASIMTSFVTSLEPGIAMRSAPDLNASLQPVCDALRKSKKRKISSITYPDEVLTSSMVGYMSRYGVDFSIERGDVVLISKLDAMKGSGKSIYGKGYLVSPTAAAKAAAAKAAAAKAAAASDYTWTLSDRERNIVNKLGDDTDGIDN